MSTQREQWLGQTQEEALEPDLAICDPHHHFWDRPGDRYFLDNLLGDTGSGHRVVQTVFVECGSMYRKDGPPDLKPVGETEFVRGIAAQSASGGYGPTAVAAGIVAHTLFSLGAAVDPVLAAHTVAGGGRFKGIRSTAAWDPSPEVTTARAQSSGMLADANYREGFAFMEKYGFSYDAIVYHPQLSELADFARAFPNVTIILNHIGRPLGIGPYAGKGDEVFEDWQRGITEVATCPNIVVKVGGLGNPISGFDWHQREVPPS